MFNMAKDYYHLRNGKMYRPWKDIDNHLVFRVYDTKTELWVAPVVMNQENAKALANNLVLSDIPFEKAVRDRKIQRLVQEKNDIEDTVLMYKARLHDIEVGIEGLKNEE